MFMNPEKKHNGLDWVNRWPQIWTDQWVCSNILAICNASWACRKCWSAPCEDWCGVKDYM